MKVREAIARLEKIAAKHGDDIQVYFDCPHCKTAFTPDFATAEPSVVLTAKQEPAHE